MTVTNLFSKKKRIIRFSIDDDLENHGYDNCRFPICSDKIYLVTITIYLVPANWKTRIYPRNAGYINAKIKYGKTV